jgi:hypothetical protein
MEGEGLRVAPSRAKSVVKKPRVKMPLIVVANSPDKSAALAGLERWKSKHAEIASLLAADDVLVDSMRGRSSTWTRIRVNMRHVPEAQRPMQETPDPDDDPTREWRQWRKKKQRKINRSWLYAYRPVGKSLPVLAGNDFELVVGAIGRLFVRSPSAKLRRMTETALHMVVSDFHYQFRSQWFPISPCLDSAALAARHAFDAFIGGTILFRPRPTDESERVFTVRLENLPPPASPY